MYEYSHGGNAVFEDRTGDIIDLSASINPLGIPEGVREAIIRAIPYCEHYPDNFSKKLREKIAEFERINPAWIFCGNGASDIIFRLPRAMRAKKVMVTAPTFSDYERSARSCGAVVMRHALSAENDFFLDGNFIESIQLEKPDFVFICNPNNPTGLLTEKGLITEVLNCCSSIGARVVVDECFLNFTEQENEYTGKVFLDRYPNLIILKAFTKLFALPGIRLGYALCADEEFLQELYFHGADWPVSALAQEAGLAALSGAEDYVKKTVDYISIERNRVKKELARLGYKVFDSTANYVFFQNPYLYNLREELDKKSIRIRSCNNFQGLDDSYYRIAVSRKEHNTKLLSAIEAIITERS